MAVGRPFRVLLASGVSVFVLAGCGAVADAEGAPVERRTFAFDGDALTVDADDSDLVITPADVDGVLVERQVDGWVVMGSGPEASWKLVDGRLTLRVDCDAMAASCSAVHRIQVPRGVAVTVAVRDGDVAAEGFSTPLTVRSGDGDVAVRKASGALDLGSQDGDVSVEDSVRSPSVAVRSDDGDVRIALAAAPRDVDVATKDGDVDVAVPKAEYEATGASDDGDVRVDVPLRGGSGHVVKLRSDDGDVTVRTVN
ncbi:DUF4097 family beta strand repeat-containing protein [Streptomyces sp. NPDC015661]|uniref:DUF4097 family beta strand repeat-containing protein n=1 Tax=Streptomyces sp. NPDC015661 TaxID=3364961 RepID=UPI0036FF14D8